MPQRLLVLKFGGASVESPKSIQNVAKIVKQRSQHVDKILVVISAMGETTDHLIDLAGKIHPNPPKREYDMLISVGERVSGALLAMALDNEGILAESYTGSQSGIITTSDHSNAKICDIRPQRIIDAFERGKVVIVSGFQGVSPEKNVTTLGRGGSDTTAVALASCLGADHVEFYKDVDGLYSEDPKNNPDATRYPNISVSDAISIVKKGGRILHLRALYLSQANCIPIYITSFKNALNDEPKIGTWIEVEEKPDGAVPIYENKIAIDACVQIG